MYVCICICIYKFFIQRASYKCLLKLLLFVITFHLLEVDSREIILSPTSPVAKRRIVESGLKSVPTTRAVNIAPSIDLVRVQCHKGAKCKSRNQINNGYHEIDAQPELRPWYCPHCAEQKQRAEKALAEGAKRNR